MSKALKYFCNKCLSPKSARLVPQFSENSTVPLNSEVIKPFNGKDYRLLECGHYTLMSNFGFTDDTTENLNEHEIFNIRRVIDKSLLNKTQKEVEEQILLHAEVYQTLLKIASKQKMQAKYAIQYLDQLLEKYSKVLSAESSDALRMKFAHFLELRPTTAKVIEREKTTVEKAADKERSAMEATIAFLKKTGYNPKDLFSAKKEEV